jgi:pyruvate decarboxylase
LSTVIRNGFTPTIILVNNKGYTVERVIHGPSRPYNDIAAWDYQNMLNFFGGKEKGARSYSASTYGELSAVIEDPDFARSGNIQLLEVHLDKFDAPWTMTAQVNLMQRSGSVREAEWDSQCQRERNILDTSLWLSRDRLPIGGEHVNAANKTVVQRGFSIE